MLAFLLAVGALVGVGIGLLLHAFGIDEPAHFAWAATTALLLVPLTVSVARSLWRRDVGVDAIALVSLAGALALGEYLAGAVVALMLAGGNVDGLVESEEAVVDESALTGEPLPVTVHRGGRVRSGTASAGVSFELRAARPAAESAYAALVRLVQQAEGERAPFVRIADRFAAFFLPATLVVAAVAWAVSGDPVRALAVFVVATPCPLILAAPIALMSGLSRAARAGIVVKGGGAIERLGAVRTVLLDKTGTITLGQPELAQVVPLDGIPGDETLRLAASLDRLSAHPLAAALVAGAEERGLALTVPEGVRESFGHGIEGVVDGHEVVVGSARWLLAHGLKPPADGSLDGGAARVYVGIDGAAAGVILLEDRIREDAGTLLPRLRSAGVEHVALVTGDKTVVAERVARELGIDRVYAEQAPEQKLEVVRALKSRPELRNVLMVGDGVNDAPALALADVGIAMGTIGATVSSETADAIILVERVDRVADAVRISRRALWIARQSVLIGIAASLVAMGFAAAGYLPPVTGALLQEVIDVAVILNALRALRG
jgi:heavy metal translocating P-type ATPase